MGLGHKEELIQFSLYFSVVRWKPNLHDGNIIHEVVIAVNRHRNLEKFAPFDIFL